MKAIPSDDSELMKYTAILRSIGEHVRIIRKSQGKSQIDLAACIDSERAVISNIENGHTNFTIKTLCKIAYSLGVDVKILFD